MKIKNIVLALCVLGTFACSCKRTGTTETKTLPPYEKVSPDFNSDSAYYFVDKQVAFGPRVPNTSEHMACADYLVSELKRFGAEVQEQRAVLTAYNGDKLNARNIIGSYGLDKKNRILLFAHWDTRPYSDQEPDAAIHYKPILGANDGASGVGVLLEIARVIQAKAPEVGIDIIFFDAEDYGTPAFAENEPAGDWWCLGSQYWSKNPHDKNYKAKYGILLDMVGAPNATLLKESFSKQYAGNVVEKIWRTGRDLGYGRYFIDKSGGYITDDHVPVTLNMRIPSADIIHLDDKTETGFGDFWHTQADNMSNISKETLHAVGQTVLEVIYKEK